MFEGLVLEICLKQVTLFQAGDGAGVMDVSTGEPQGQKTGPCLILHIG